MKSLSTAKCSQVAEDHADSSRGFQPKGTILPLLSCWWLQKEEARPDWTLLKLPGCKLCAQDPFTI